MQSGFNTVDALASAGKTWSMLRHVITQAATGRKYLITQPSTELIDQTLADIRERGPAIKATVYHAGITKHPVADIARHFHNAAPGGEVVVISHAAFFRLSHIHRRNDWHLIVDEIPQVEWTDTFRLPEHVNKVLDLVTPVVHDDDWFRVVANEANRKLIQAIAINERGDEIWERFQPLANLLLSPHHELSMRRSAYQRFLQAPSDKSKELGRHDLTIHARMLPTVFGLMTDERPQEFASVTLMGSNLKDSMLYKSWSAKEGVGTRPHRVIKPRFDCHPNGSLVTIYYASEKSYSKALRDARVRTPDGGTSTFGELFVQAAVDVFGDAPFVYMTNKDNEKLAFGERARPTKLPNSPHGLNCYQGFHNALILSALNPSTGHFGYIEKYLGVKSAEAQRSLQGEKAYQGVARTSLRDLTSTDPKTFIVPDKAIAACLNHVLRGSRVRQLPMMEGIIPDPELSRKPGRVAKVEHPKKESIEIGPLSRTFDPDSIPPIPSSCVVNTCGRPPVYGTDKERKAADAARNRDNRARKKHIADLIAQQAAIHAPGQRNHDGSAFLTYDSPQPIEVCQFSDIEGFEANLRRFANKRGAKEARALIAPALYDGTRTATVRTRRGKGNIISCRHIWTDIDDGRDLSPERISRLFPELHIIIYSSYSSTPEKPRYRVIFPTIQRMSVTVYEDIVAQIVARIEVAGFLGKDALQANPRASGHGLDEGKLHAASLFHMPCEAHAGPSATFFHSHAGEGRQPLDVDAWIKHPALIPVAPPPKQPPATIAPAISGTVKEKVKQATAAFVSAGPGEGDHAFNALGWRLRGYGLHHDLIEDILRDAANVARHPADRRRQIPRVMDGIRAKATRYIDHPAA